MDLKAEADSLCRRQMVALLKQVTKTLVMFFLVSLLSSSPSDDTLKTDAKFLLPALLFRVAASFILLTFAKRPAFFPFLNDAVSPPAVSCGQRTAKVQSSISSFLKPPAKRKKNKKLRCYLMKVRNTIPPCWVSARRTSVQLSSCPHCQSCFLLS